MKLLLSVGAIVTTAALAAALFVSPTNPARAAAQEMEVASSSSENAYSDANVLEFLSTGRGPLAKALPDLVPNLPHVDDRLTKIELRELVAEYRRVDPRLHENIVLPVLSGDPYRTLGGLERLADATQEVAKSKGSETTGVGDGKCATLVTVALWLVVALAVVLWVPARMADSGGTSITTEAFAAAMASGLKR